MRSTMLYGALGAGLLAILPVAAQSLELKLADEQPYYRYAATVPSPARSSGSDETASLELLLSSVGDIADVTLSFPSGEICKPVCRVAFGKMRCLSCDPSGNPGMLSIIEIAVSAPNQTMSSGKPALTVSYQPLDLDSSNPLGIANTFTLTPDRVPH